MRKPATFKFRFRFNLSHKGMIQGEGDEYKFELPNSHEATFRCLGADTFSDGMRFSVTSGRYDTEDAAFRSGQNVKLSTLCFAVKYRVGIDIGKDIASSRFSTAVKDKIFEKQQVMFVDDVHGISVFSEEFETMCSSISATGLVSPRDEKFFAEELCNIASKCPVIDDKVKLAMELVTSAYFESSNRSRFLTYVLAAESLLNPIPRSPAARYLIEKLIEQTKTAGLPETEMNSILGSLNWLFDESISRGLQIAATKHLPHKQYGKLPAADFIKKCYSARSKLVHSGTVDENKFELGLLSAHLEMYMKDMLLEIVGI